MLAVFLLLGLVHSCSSGQRTLTIQNKCSYSIWLSGTGGYTGKICPCSAGMACNPNNNMCFWSLPTPSKGSWQFTPGSSDDVCLPNQSGSVQWSGNVFARTGCNADGTGCQTGNCGQQPYQGCQAGVGGTPPATLAEFTFADLDYYDVSTINGVNVPVSMGSTAAQSSDPYFCASAGASVPSNSKLSGCSWKFNTVINGVDYSTSLRQVAVGNIVGCSRDSDCGGGQICGLAWYGGKFQHSCGTFTAWWSAIDVCSLDKNWGAPYNCGEQVPGQNGAYGTLTTMYGCTLGGPSGSCYQPGADGTCCGCPHWVNATGQALPSTMTCYGDNSFWHSAASPMVSYLKNACPTAYSFPYDDATSTFTCKTSSSPNSANYVITFCP